MRWGQAIALISLSALAEEHVPFRPTASGPFVTFTAPITPKGRLLAQPIFSATFAHASLDASGRPVADGPQAGLRGGAASLFAELGVDDAVALGTQLTFVYADRKDAASYGLGEALVFGRRVLFEENVWRPEATFLVQFKLPTGNAVGVPSLLGTDVRGSGSADLTIGIDLTRGIRPVLVHADLLLTHPLPAQIGPIDVQYGDALSWAISVEWPFFPDRFGVMFEASGRHQLAPVIGGSKVAEGHVDEIILGAGAELLFTADVQLLIGYQRTLWGRNVGSFDSVVVTLVPVFL